MKLAKRVIKPETSDKMRFLMRLNAEIGTARKADVKGYYIGGKTAGAGDTLVLYIYLVPSYCWDAPPPAGIPCRRSQLSGLLALPAVLDRLPKHAVLVAQPVAHRRELQGRHRIEEARCQPPETAIAEPGIGFLLHQAEPVQVALEQAALDGPR